MKARPWLVVFVPLLVLLFVAGSLTIPATLAQGPTDTVYLPFVQAPPPLQVLSNYSVYQTSYGSLHILGEVENLSGSLIYWMKVTVDFYDANHHLVANDYTQLHLQRLPPRDKSCFDLLILNVPSHASFEFEMPSYYAAYPSEPLNLTVVDPSASYNASTGAYRIIGLVRNDSAARVNDVYVVGTLYNATGTVVGCEGISVNSTDLDPGQSSSFTLFFSGRDEADVASWRLQTDGWLQ